MPLAGFAPLHAPDAVQAVACVEVHVSRVDAPPATVVAPAEDVYKRQLLTLNVGQRWLTEMMKLKLRQGLVRDLVEHWMQPGRAFRLANAGAIGVNPDQRMHEDARHLTELSADLGVGLLQACLLYTSRSPTWTG